MKKKLLIALALSCFFVSAIGQINIGPLMTTSWHQKAPYNLLCPVIETDTGVYNSVAGCGAIAVAQILKKYGKPTHGFGHSYYLNNKTNSMVDVDYSQLTMEWNKVQDSYSSTITGTEAEQAVASIVYQVGAAMQMSYYTSSAPKNMGQMMWGLHHYLHMNPDSRYRRRVFYSTPEWIEMLHHELQAGRPVYYRGEWNYETQSAAHIFVIDGMKADGTYHANYGNASYLNKFVSLDILNFNKDYEIPGGRVVCYNFGQAMITDFYPVDGLTDDDYCAHSLILGSNIYFTNNISSRSLQLALGEVLKLQMKLRDCSLTGGSVPFGLGIYQNGQLLRVLRDNSHLVVTFSGGGLEGNRVCNVKLPVDLTNGEYELRLVFSPDDGLSWHPVWDNAPNHMSMVVTAGNAHLTLAPDYTRETQLYLREPIHKVKNVCESYPTGKGTAFRVALRNPTVNNFEDNIKFEFQINGHTEVYEVKCAIYGERDVDFDILIPETMIDLKDKDYSYKAYYYEHNQGDYVELTTEITSAHGDVNGDGKVSIDDLTILIDRLLNDQVSDVGLFVVDCNADGYFTIDDVVSLIDILLSL